MSLPRTLRAFAWLRWRVFVNSLERTGSRDALERFSLAIEKLGPIMAAVLMVPSLLAVGVLGAAAGYLIASGDGDGLVVSLLRFGLLAVPALCVVGPLLLPAADRTNPVRMLLLPIPRHTLYVAQAASALTDPWTLLVLPLVVAVPAGLAAGGAAGAALLTLAAGVALLLFVVGLSALVTTIIHLVARDRRRGELLALVFILVMPVLALLPGLLDGSDRRARRDAAYSEPAARTERPLVPSSMLAYGRAAFSWLPTERYVAGARLAAEGEGGSAAVSAAAVAGAALLLHAVGLAAFVRVLDSPGGTSARRAAGAGGPARRIPLLSAGASAVALSHVRLAMRTPRGRAILLSPLMMFLLFGAWMWQNGGGVVFGPFRFESGLGLATFVSFVALTSILPIAMNQFAVDGAGLTLVLLSPLTVREYLTGKAVGNGIIAAAPALLFIPVAALLFPGGSPALWLALLLSLFAVYVLVAPAAAACSALFPRVVDMNSVARGSNAHGAAGLLGLLAFVLAGLPCAGLVLLATRGLERPSLAPLLVGAWALVALAASVLLLRVAERVFGSRRENLALLS